jgi:hypothetical protein
MKRNFILQLQRDWIGEVLKIVENGCEVEVVVVGPFKMPSKSLADRQIVSLEHIHVNLLQLELLLVLVSMLLRRQVISVFFEQALVEKA